MLRDTSEEDYLLIPDASLVVYFERQGVNRMCGLHALNAALQGPAFTAQTLEKLGWSLDASERQLLTDAGNASGASNPVVRTLATQNESNNVSFDGFFSIGVMDKALASKNIVCIPFRHPTMQHARSNPTAEDCFLCNLQEHWFVFRRVGQRWFKVDSMKALPEYVPDNSLPYHLEDLIARQYSVFVVMHKDYPLARLPLPNRSPQGNKPRTATLSSVGVQGAYATLKEILGATSGAGAGGASGASAGSGTGSIGATSGAGGAGGASGAGTIPNMEPRNPAVPEEAEMDAELRQAMEESALAFLAQLPEPCAEDPAGIPFRITSQHMQGATVDRRFPLGATLHDLCAWVMKDPAINAGLVPPVGARREFVLSTVAPPATSYVCYTEGGRRHVAMATATPGAPPGAHSGAHSGAPTRTPVDTLRLGDTFDRMGEKMRLTYTPE